MVKQDGQQRKVETWLSPLQRGFFPSLTAWPEEERLLQGSLFSLFFFKGASKFLCDGLSILYWIPHPGGVLLTYKLQLAFFPCGLNKGQRSETFTNV
jgi:hypothetical protein